MSCYIPFSDAACTDDVLGGVLEAFHARSRQRSRDTECMDNWVGRTVETVERHDEKAGTPVGKSMSRHGRRMRGRMSTGTRLGPPGPRI